MNEQLKLNLVEPGNMLDKYAVCVKKNNVIVINLSLGETGRLAKLVFYFLSADIYASCNVVITGKS